MNPESSDHEMRAEYDIAGGVRGKYFERYRQGTATTITLAIEPSALVNITTSRASSTVSITRSTSYPITSPSRRTQPSNYIVADPVHAGQDSPRG
jgi:hypothetical protein